MPGKKSDSGRASQKAETLEIYALYVKRLRILVYDEANLN